MFATHRYEYLCAAQHQGNQGYQWLNKKNVDARGAIHFCNFQPLILTDFPGCRLRLCPGLCTGWAFSPLSDSSGNGKSAARHQVNQANQWLKKSVKSVKSVVLFFAIICVFL